MHDPWFRFVLLYAGLFAGCALAFWAGTTPVRVVVLVFSAVVALLTFLNPAYFYRRLGSLCVMFVASGSAYSAWIRFDAEATGRDPVARIKGELLFGAPDGLTLGLAAGLGVLCLLLDQLPELARLLRERVLDVKVLEGSLVATVSDDSAKFRFEFDVAAVGGASVYVSEVGVRLRAPLQRTHWFEVWEHQPAGAWIPVDGPVAVAPGRSERLRAEGRIKTRVPAFLQRLAGRVGLAWISRAEAVPLVVTVRTSEAVDAILTVTARPAAPRAA